MHSWGCDLKHRLAVLAKRCFRSGGGSAEGEPAPRGLSSSSERPLDRLLHFASDSRWLGIAPVKSQDGRDPDLRDGFLSFVLDVLASAELSLDLDVIAFLESGGEGSQPAEHNGVMSFGCAILPGVLGRQ